MNVGYLFRELYYQKRRTLTAILGLSIGIALLIILNTLSMAYRQAAHAPLQAIGADISVQRPGDVPKDLAGAVFPCSAVTISQAEVEKIQGLPAEMRRAWRKDLSRRGPRTKASIMGPGSKPNFLKR